MPRTTPESVNDYIASQPATIQSILQRVRSTIRKAVPEAEEVISYKIPTYKLYGGAMLYFAGWKRHYSLYPANDNVVAAFKDDLVLYEISKGYDPLSALAAGAREADRPHCEVSCKRIGPA